MWIGGKNRSIEYEFETDTDIRKIRLVFDSNLNRSYHNMPCRYLIDEKEFKLPGTLIKEYTIVGIGKDGERKTITVKDNHQRFVVHNVDWKVKKIRFIPLSTHGCDKFRVFNFEIE